MSRIITAQLPPREHYREIEKSDRIILVDGKSDRFQISIPAGGVWGVWEISIQENFNKSDKINYLSRVRLKCMKPILTATHRIDRETYKGLMGYGYECDWHYVIPIGDRLWLDYTIRK